MLAKPRDTSRYLSRSGADLPRDTIARERGDGTLMLRNNQIKSKVFVSNKNVHLVRRGDYFIKFKDSNKCIIKRNDSIMYIDCIDFYPLEIRDSLDEIQEWPRETVGKWQKYIIPKR